MKMNRKQVGIAMGISLLLMVASVAVVKAAPEAQEPPRISLIQAILVGILFYFSISPWFANLGYTVLYRPLVGGALVGLVMGRPGEGVAIGANINILYLGWISAGGSLPGDMGMAGYLGTAVALGGGLGVDGALAVAAPIGLLGGLNWSLRMSACSIIPHWADRFAEEGDVDKVARANYIYSQPFLFVIYAIPIMIAAYLGSQAVAAALGWFAANAMWVMNGLFAAQYMLSALGIALNLKFLFQGNVWPYFFVGFAITTLAGGQMNLVLFAIIGAAVAFVHVLFTEGLGGGEAEGGTEARKAPGLLTRQDVFQSFIRWLCFSHACYNWERMQGLGFAHSMTPIIKKLYTTKEDISAALKRHLVFYNTQPDVGGVIHGIVIAMEEDRAAGADISDDAINAVKTGLMGPMAGIGDTLQQAILIPIALALGISIALGGDIEGATTGTFLGPIVYLVLVAIGIWGGGWFLFWQGYQQGRTAVTNILKSGTLNRVITGAGVLGNWVMGALVVQYVKISTSVAFMVGGNSFEVQALLDRIIPNLLALLAVLLIWWLVAKRNVSPTTIMIVIILVGVLGSIPIWPGLDAETGEAIRTGFF
jgi:PTS system mannose-specific IID component